MWRKTREALPLEGGGKRVGVKGRGRITFGNTPENERRTL
jgi:hypothetical protein